MHRQRVADLAGVGAIYNGEVLIRDGVHYSIEVWQEFPSGIPGLKELRGRIKLDHLALIPLIGTPLTLKFDTGHKMQFFFKNTSGEFGNMTGITTDEGQPLV